MDGAFRRTARLLFSFSGTISRNEYIVVAFVGVILKHALDVIAARNVFAQPWGLLNYIIPLSVPVPILSMTSKNIEFVLFMLALSMPFAWIGLAITTKRFRTVGWPPWLVVLFFVPIANIASFAVAAAAPDHEESDAVPVGFLARIAPRDRFGAAIAGVIGSVVIGLILAFLGTHVLTSYGWGLFAAVPFAQGAFAVVFFNAHERRSVMQNIGVAMLSVLLTGAAMLAIAFEGAICILMAMPLALFFALVGALFGHAITRRSLPQTASMLMLIAIVPVIMGADEQVTPEAPLHVVETSITVDAPPSVVWAHVVDFPDLPAPTETVFRIGVAYPERARIVGTGVGAIRYCEFSTGDFVEPITVWQPGRRLAFDVTKSAEPMREWSPYGPINTPHLHGYMLSRRGEFMLEPLSGGRTRLIGRTWYQHHLWPDEYWTLWSDGIIHDIHARVLTHVKHLSEGGT